MTGDDRLVFQAGVMYAAEALQLLIRDLVICMPEIPSCETCDAYQISADTIAKWLAAELDAGA